MAYFINNGGLLGLKITNKQGVYDQVASQLFTTGPVEPIILTNASKTGSTGPTLAECQAAYAGQPFLDFLSVNFGYQSYTIQVTGYYKFTLKGASGGVWTTSPVDPQVAASAPTIEGFQRLPGATVIGTYFLVVGDIITVVVGQGGGDDTNSAANCPGGGGGTMVTLGSFSSVQNLTDQLLFVAGGGAGIGYQSLDSGTGVYSVGIGQAGTSGGGGLTGMDAAGANGNGAATAFTSSNSCGGAGYLTGLGNSVTTSFTYTHPTSQGPIALRRGALGGSATGFSRGFGGFGGGGCGAATTSSDDDKGGGGGYSGGSYGFDAARHGGGGGSFTNASAIDVTTTAGGNTTDRHGSVKIELVV